MPEITVRERLPIVPYSGHSARAIRFSKLNDIYFAIGKPTPWPGDESAPDFIPPEPDMNAITLEELIGMKKTSRVMLVQPDDAGEIVYQDSSWTGVTEEQAIANNARWVMVETTIYYTDFAVNQYRQIGIYSGVVTVPGVDPALKLVLLPEDIQTTGSLEVLDNRHVVTRQTDTKDVFRMIIEF